MNWNQRRTPALGMYYQSLDAVGDMQKDAWDFLVSLRQNLLTAISGIENADPSLYFDDTRPNFKIRGHLNATLGEAVKDAAAFGVLVVTRHSDCGRHHKQDGNGHSYAMSNPYGLEISYRDERYIWENATVFMGLRRETCPCSSRNEPSEHYVIDDVIYDPISDLAFCRTIYSILSDISSAVEQAEDKHPRSAFREYLLRAVIRLNDAILPETVDMFILQESKRRERVT